MPSRKRIKAKKLNLFQKTWKLHNNLFKWLFKWFLRSLLVVSRRGRQTRLSPKSGFVLPTATMVLLVAVLLTTAMLFRSFDRSSSASNTRVNQAVLKAAIPGLDRARAKIDALFADPTLPRATPSDQALYTAFASNRYTLGDETRLKLVREFNGQTNIQSNTTSLEDDETLTSAWKFPVDTDNNGKFDSFTLYGIYFRSPTRNNVDGKFNRARNPLEARTPPMGEGQLGGRCAAALATSASIVGDSDWYKSGNKLKKNFFVYTANVPITNIGSLNTNQYEQYQGSQGFSALELQQDRTRIPLNNNAAWYEDDIEISNATTVRLNGRIFTNSNLLVAGNGSNKTIFYQVSDPDSCYYDQENSKITVSGNVANGDIQYITDEGNVEVHRFQRKGTSPDGTNDSSQGISSTNKTTMQTGGRWVGYNNQAYSQRIGLLVQAALALHGTTDPTVTSVEGVARYPQEVKDRFKQRFNDPNKTKESKQILTEELQTYFKERIRRVPYAEVPGSTGSETALGSYTASNILGSTSPILPPDAWMTIENPTTGNSTTGLSLNFSSNTMNLKATELTKQQKDGKEYFIGDRILVGNNLPFLWSKYTATGTFDKFADRQELQPVKNGTNAVYWNDPSSGNATSTQRTRQSRVQDQPDLGSVDRDGFWETEAAKKPDSNENTGGLRVITGAGIYIDGVGTGSSGGIGVRGTDSFLPAPALNSGITDPQKFTTATITTNNDNIIVWPDSMPLWDGSKKGDLQMRATAVYHYKQGSAATTGVGQVDPNQVPIACISSYYDPTDSTTARNLSGLADVSGLSDTNGDGTINSSDKLADGSTPSPAVGSNSGRSNNGITYNAPYTDDSGRTSALSTYRAKLNRQARLIFPTGRIVNASLRKALTNIDANKPRSLADNAAIDTAICALKTLDGTLSVQASPSVPHGAIKEAAFLDARQVKSLNNLGSDNTKIAETQTNLTDRYTLPLEQRQPLEIRVTELDLNLLKTKEIGTATNSNNDSANNQEYLLPNSGIIYATRNDTLPDLSDNSTDPTTQALVSATDFKLDSTRRPNGIRLINGSNLARKNFYRIAEKGLILATNLPTYIKGNFNLHRDPNESTATAREEFTDALVEADWSNFYTRSNTLDDNFACRQNQTGCGGTGDQWRPATIISDAQTLLSNNFWDGFRNQGDYDLNNNRGNSAASSRTKQGFWNNNFVTSAQWASSGGYPTANYKNSYLINGVTPIQRRVDGFPEYIMEICRKLPVSECQPNDWVVGLDINGDGDLEDTDLVTGIVEKTVKANQLGQALVAKSLKIAVSGKVSISGATVSVALGSKADKELLGAGTTARPALVAADRRYPRRVAFARRKNNLLVLTAIGSNATPQPLGVGCPLDTTGNTFENNGCNYPNSPTRTAGVHYGNTANDALWFRTTSNTSGNPGAAANITYVNNQPLYILPDSQGGNKLIAPPTPDFPRYDYNNDGDFDDPGEKVPSLNSPSGNPASRYTVCTKNDGATNSPLVTQATSSTSLTQNCDTTGAFNAAQDTLDGLLVLNPNISTTDNIVVPTRSGTIGLFPAAAGTTTIFTSNPPASPQPGSIVNIIDISGDFAVNGSDTIIKLQGDDNSIFVLRNSGSNLNFGSSSGCSTCRGVQLVLEGVDPNNVFWAADSNIKWNAVSSSYPHRIAGTILNKGTGSPKWDNLIVEGGRILGVNGVGSFTPDTRIYAISSNGQPSLVPVLQIHSPTGSPGGTTFDGQLQDNWLQVATTTTANAAFVIGDSPSRPNPSEGGGGLHNLLRFLENWNNQTARISGSLIQHKRSSYASAPFNPVDPTITDASASLFYTLNGSNQPPYSSNTGFRYRGGASDSRTSSYSEPNRSFGFDVAILSQLPDLFAQRFTQLSTSRPNEYFREVGQDDLWIQTLLCAGQASDRVGGTGATFTTPAISNRPSSCPISLPYPANP